MFDKELLKRKQPKRSAIVVQITEGLKKGKSGFYYPDEERINGKLRVYLIGEKILISPEKLRVIGFAD